MIQCPNCTTTWEEPFLHCPTCGQALISVGLGTSEDILKFYASGYQRMCMVGIGNAVQGKLSNPLLTPLGMQFSDQNGKTRLVPLIKVFEFLRSSGEMLSI